MKLIHTHIIFLFLFLFFTVSVLSQNTKIDSFEIKLKKHVGNDSTRVYLLNDLAFLYYKTDLDKAKMYLEEAVAIADSIDFIKGKAESIYIKGITQAIETNFKKGIDHFKESLQLYTSIDNKIGMDKCYNNMGVFFFHKGDQKQAIVYYQKSLKTNEELDNKRGASKAVYSIGRAFNRLGDHSKALMYYKRAITIYKEINNEKGVSSCLTDIGNIYLFQGNYSFALNYYNEALSIDNKLKDSVNISNKLTNIGTIYSNLYNAEKAIQYFEKALAFQKNNYDKKDKAAILINLGIQIRRNENFHGAHKYFAEALELYEKANDNYNIATCYINIGLNYFYLENYEASYEYFNKAKRTCLEFNNRKSLSSSYLGIARVYAKKKEYSNALVNALKSKEIAEELQLTASQKEISELLSTIYRNTGDYKKALASHQQFKILNDSLFNKKKTEKIAQIESEYKYRQQLDSAKIRELKLTNTVKDTSQDLEKSKQNYLWVIIGFLMVSILLGAIIFYLKFRNIKSKNQNIVIEQKLLRSQMTPHFIFNSLSVLQGMILNKEEKKSITYLSKFSKLLRIILENSRDKMVLLSHELVAIENYLALQNLENEAYNYKVIVDEAIDDTLFQIPPMLIQPFVENAIEHAFSNKITNRQIDVLLKYSDKKMICVIMDNGIGIDVQTLSTRKNKKSLATAITSERLQILSKDFNMKGSVTIQDRQKDNEQGTIVTIVIPHRITAA